MSWSAFLHRSTRCSTLWRRLFQLVAVLIAAGSLWEALCVHHQFRPSPDHPLNRPSSRGRIYIASIQSNTETLLRRHWNHAVVELARTLGPENVFVSVWESGSEDDTEDALQDLDHGLHRFGIPRNITLGFPTVEQTSRTAAKDHGWMAGTHEIREQRRIPHLARRRNASLQPFYNLLANGITFDRILFLEDVVFTVWETLLFSHCSWFLTSLTGRYRHKMFFVFWTPTTATMRRRAPSTSINPHDIMMPAP